MTSEKLLELAAKNCRQAITDCAAAEQNATDFYRAGKTLGGDLHFCRREIDTATGLHPKNF